MAIKSIKKESAKSRFKDNGHHFLATPGTHPSKVLDLQESRIINRDNHRKCLSILSHTPLLDPGSWDGRTAVSSNYINVRGLYFSPIEPKFALGRLIERYWI
jgi:hypothetical protein